MNDENDDWAGQSNANPEDAFSFDANEADASKTESRLYVDKAGKYHMEVARVTRRLETINEQGKPCAAHLIVSCVVLESVVGQSPAGSYLNHTIYLSAAGGGPPEKGSIDAAASFFRGVGILIEKDGKLVRKDTGASAMSLADMENLLENRQFIADIKLRKSNDPQYADKFELPFGRGAFTVDDPAVRTVPKNLPALKLIGMEKYMPPVATAATVKESGGKGKAKEPAPAANTAAPVAPVATPAPASAPQQQPAVTQAPAQTAAPVAVAPAEENFDDL